MKGLVHIYTGNGKGKTTCAIGLGIRAYGSGLKVLMVQFLKGAQTSELKTLAMLEPGFRIFRTKDVKGFLWDMNEEQKKLAGEAVQKAFKFAEESALNGQCDVLILDEIVSSVTTGLLSLSQVTDFLQKKPESLEVIMTGRNAPLELVELSDYVSDINEVKHPYSKGIKARKGIEF